MTTKFEKHIISQFWLRKKQLHTYVCLHKFGGPYIWQRNSRLSSVDDRGNNLRAGVTFDLGFEENNVSEGEESESSYR